MSVSRRTQHIAAFGLLLIGAVVLRLMGIDIFGFGDHEIPTLMFCMSSTIGESNGILYHNGYLPLWIQIWGDSLLSMRLASVTCSVVGVIGMYFLGRKIGGQKMGLASAFFLAINDYDILMSQHIRFHELNSCICIWGTLAFIVYLEHPSVRNWLTYTIVAIAGIGSMVLSYLLFCMHLIGALLFVPSSRRNWLGFFGLFTVFTICFAFLWGIDAAAYPRMDTTDKPTFCELLASYWTLFAFTHRYIESLGSLFETSAEQALLLITAIVLIWHLVCICRRRCSTPRYCGLLWSFIAIIPIIWIGSYYLKPIFKTTNLSFVLPLSALVIAMCLRDLPRWGRYLILFALLLLNQENCSSHSYFDRYSNDACVQHIVDYMHKEGEYPHTPGSKFPSYVYGFSWNICADKLFETDARIFLDAMQYQSNNGTITSEGAFWDMIRDAQEGAFPANCDLWYYTPFSISDEDLTLIMNSLNPCYISTYDFMGRCLCRIHIANRPGGKYTKTHLPYRIKGSFPFNQQCHLVKTK